MAEFKGKQGWVPSNYLEEYVAPKPMPPPPPARKRAPPPIPPQNTFDKPLPQQSATPQAPPRSANGSPAALSLADAVSFFIYSREGAKLIYIYLDKSKKTAKRRER